MSYQFLFFPIGFSERGFKELQAQIDSYEVSVKLVEHITPGLIKDVDALIVDFDNEESMLTKNLNKCQELLPKRPIIGLSSAPIGLDQILTLIKPFNRSSFGLILEKINGKKMPLEKKSREIRAIYSDPDSPLHYPINNCFQTYLVKAWKLHKKVEKPIELTFLNKPVLVLYKDKVSVLLSNDRLQQLCSLTIYEHSISIACLPNDPSAVLQSQDASYFISQIILWSSHGRLPEGVNSTDTVRLTKPETQCHFPKIEGSQLIRELWLERSCSLQEAEEVLLVDQANLFSYFSVLYALDFVEVRSSKPSAKTKPKGKKKLSQWDRLEQNIFLQKKDLVPNSL